METLRDKPLMRRVLATLPAWYSDEDNARLDAEAAKIGHVRVRRHSFEEMLAEMQANPHAYMPVEVDGEPSVRPMSAEEVQRSLEWLAAQKWAASEHVVPVDPEQPGSEHWYMTQAGFEELHRPEAAATNVVPGPVKLDLQPAVQQASAEGGVSANA